MMRFLVLALGTLLFGCGTDEEAPGGGSDLIHNEVLEKLGVQTALPPLSGADGNPVQANYNPLSRKRRALRPLDEIYMAGVPSPAGGRQILRDDGSQAYTVLDMGAGDSAWAKLPKVSTAGDLDGDGREEVALLVLDNDPASSTYKQLTLRVVEDKAEAFAVKEVPVATLTDADLTHLESTLGGYYLKLDIGAGDIDGDGRDEIFAAAPGHLWVIDDREADKSYGIILEKSFPASGGASQFLRVGGGDTDGDGKAEMVVVDGQMDLATKTGTVTYHIYDELVETKSGQVKRDTISCELMTADVAVGDVDGDRLGEIVFSGRKSGEPTTHVVLVMDDGQSGYGFLKVDYSYNPIYSQDPTFVPLHRVETGDFDGDNVAEIVSFDQILDDLRTNQGLVKAATLPYDVGWSTVLAVGDVTNDHKDDIVFYRGSVQDALVVVYGTDSNGSYTSLHTFDIPDDLTYITLTTVNTDDDSVVLEFKGHQLRFSSPRVLAVMAAPPHHKDIPTDNTLAGTIFGKTASGTVETEKSLGFKVGWSYSSSGRFGPLFGTSFSVSLETSFDWITSKSTTIEVAYSYISAASSDKVVFTAVPFDVYFYEIVSSPRPDEVGEKMVVSIPRDPKILFVDRQFFNDNNGGFADIDGTVLGHTVGDPRSYPREAEIDKAGLVKDGGFYSNRMTVGQGNGFETVLISHTETTSQGRAFDLNIDVSIQVGIDFDIGLVSGSAKTGPKGGFHYGFSYSISAGEKSSFGAKVGNIIDGADWAKHRFDFGLYVQPTTFEGQKFPLIGYWVD
jgi:hypothetical protein